MFMSVVDDLGTRIVATGDYALEFVKNGAFLFIDVKYWKNGNLTTRIVLRRGGCSSGQTRRAVFDKQRDGCITTKPALVCRLGSTYQTIHVSDESPNCRYGKYHRPRFEEIYLSAMTQKKEILGF